MFHAHCSRRSLLSLALRAAGSLAVGSALPVRAGAEEFGDEALMKRFEHLSATGNSNCSSTFLDSIATLPAEARLQGSCCAPMDAHRYIEQVGKRLIRARSFTGKQITTVWNLSSGCGGGAEQSRLMGRVRGAG